MINNSKLSILPGSIKEFIDQKDKVCNNYDPNRSVFGLDDYLFKAFRDKYVDTSINELGCIFFSFEYVDICSDTKESRPASLLKNLYAKFSQDNYFANLSCFSDFIKKTALASIKKNLTIRAHDLIVPKFEAGPSWEPETNPHGPYEFIVYPFVDEKDFLDFEFSEFAYFVINPQRPRNFYPEMDSNSELFSLKGFLVVRNILGYNECEPMIREIESRRPFFHSAADRFESPFGGNFCLKALRTPEEAKSYWDSLVEPFSILNMDQTRGLHCIWYMHGSLLFRPNVGGIFRSDFLSLKDYESLGFPSSIDFYSNCFMKNLYEHYDNRCDGYVAFRDSSFYLNAYEDGRVSDPKMILKSSILGVPVRCSYSTPAVLYNLFNIFVKVNSILFREGIYYQSVDGAFIKPLGNELWFKEHYFEIVDNLFFHFDFFVRGVDYLKLFSLQVDNVLALMKLIPLDGTYKWRIKESETSKFDTNYSFLKTPNKITYVSN